MLMPEPIIPPRQLITLYVEGGITGDYEINIIDDSELKQWIWTQAFNWLIDTHII